MDYSNKPLAYLSPVDGDTGKTIDAHTGNPFAVTGLPSSAEQRQFVTPRGNDANDGLSLVSAKASIGAAVATGAKIIQLGTGTFSSDISTVSVPAGVQIIGSGLTNTTINYQGSGFLFSVQSPSVQNVPSACIGNRFSGFTINGVSGNTTSDGGISINGAYEVLIDWVKIHEFRKSNAVGIQLQNCFNVTAKHFHVYDITNGIGVDMTGANSADIQFTNLQFWDFLVQRNAIGYRVNTPFFGESMHIFDGAVNVPDACVGIQFTGRYGDITLGPGLHVESNANNAVSNTSVGVQAVANSALFVQMLTCRGMNFANINKLFDLDGSTGVINSVDIDQVYASQNGTGLNGTAFHMNNVKLARIGARAIDTTAYPTANNVFTSTLPSWQTSVAPTSSRPGAQDWNLGQVFIPSDGVAPQLFNVSLGAANGWGYLVHANNSGNVQLPGTAVVYPSTNTRIVFGTGDPETVQTAAYGSYFIDTSGGDVYIKQVGGNSNTGWRLVQPADRTRTQVQLRLASGNTNAKASWKYKGQWYFDSTNGKPVWASGANTTDPWVDATGTTVHTPS